MEVPPSHAKMRLKSALQKLNFSMAKAIQKCYTLNCSLKCPCRFPHIYTRYATSFSRKIILYETNNIFYSLGNQKWEKTNSWSWNMRSRWSEFWLCQQLFAYKRFCMETRLNNILKTTNTTKFSKTILVSTYKVVLGIYNLVSPTRPVSLLRAVEF